MEKLPNRLEVDAYPQTPPVVQEIIEWAALPPTIRIAESISHSLEHNQWDDALRDSVGLMLAQLGNHIDTSHPEVSDIHEVKVTDGPLVPPEVQQVYNRTMESFHHLIRLWEAGKTVEVPREEERVYGGLEQAVYDARDTDYQEQVQVALIALKSDVRDIVNTSKRYAIHGG